MRMLAFVAVMAIGFIAPTALADQAAPADVGYVVMSVGAPKGEENTRYSISIRRQDGSGEQNVKYVVNHASLLNAGFLFGKLAGNRSPDYEDADGEGAVEVLNLPAGDYEVYSYRISMSTAVLPNGQSIWDKWEPPAPFRVPFHVQAGVSVYIGNFTGFRTRAVTPLPEGVEQKDGAFIVVSDRSARDIPAAKKREPNLPEPVVAIADAKAAGSPLVRSAK